jgi:hypothetical protein
MRRQLGVTPVDSVSAIAWMVWVPAACGLPRKITAMMPSEH